MLLVAERSLAPTVHDSWQLNKAKDEYRQRFLDHWNATKERTSTGQPIDGLILPPSVATAHKHCEWHFYIPYTSLFSAYKGTSLEQITNALSDLVDLPALVLPTGSKVDPILDAADENYQPVSKRDADIQASCKYFAPIDEETPLKPTLDKPELFENAPVSVQLVGRRYREEEVIGMGELIVEALKAAK
jgi:amidase